MTDKTSIVNSREHRSAPDQFIEPAPEELKARGKRNIAIAVSLAAFMIFVFVTMVSRSA